MLVFLLSDHSLFCEPFLWVVLSYNRYYFEVSGW